MTEKPHCRPLTFSDLDAVVRDVAMLHEGGYRQAGNWDLAQICGHLADWMRFPLDGYPAAPLPMRIVLWTIRVSSGKRMLRRLLETGSMPSGSPTVKETVPEQGGNEAAAVGRLRDVIARFQAHRGPCHPSPLFGALDAATTTQLQLIHCAHHLRNLIPHG